MIEDAEKKGLLTKIPLSLTDQREHRYCTGLCGGPQSYRLILTMPETMSVERRKILKAFGAGWS